MVRARRLSDAAGRQGREREDVGPVGAKDSGLFEEPWAELDEDEKLKPQDVVKAIAARWKEEDQEVRDEWNAKAKTPATSDDEVEKPKALIATPAKAQKPKAEKPKAEKRREARWPARGVGAATGGESSKRSPRAGGRMHACADAASSPHEEDVR